MKKLMLFFLIVILVSIFIHPAATVQARSRCERTGIVSGTIIFVDLVFDTVLFVPRLVIRTLTWPVHGYRSYNDRNHYRDDSPRHGKGHNKRGKRDRRGRKGR